VIILFIWARRVFKNNSYVKRATLLAIIFIVLEALLGAGLVLFEWVAYDASIGRAISMALHLVNTFLLLASLALTAWWSRDDQQYFPLENRYFLPGLIVGALGIIILGVSGALTALGDTLFPADTLVQGVQQDFSPTAHFLIRLRLLHPTIATFVSVYLIILVSLIRMTITQPIGFFFARSLVVLLVVQLGVGLLNVVLLAPIWMQLLHLLLADLLWITLILFSFSFRNSTLSGAL
jgi:heme A synthase